MFVPIEVIDPENRNPNNLTCASKKLKTTYPSVAKYQRPNYSTGFDKTRNCRPRLNVVKRLSFRFGLF